jgi:beta-galactosidase
MRRYIDWGEFQADTMAEIFGEWSRPLETSLPVVINQNPPQNAPYGLDAFLSRAEPEAWPGFHYGFTNWVGDVSARPGAFSRYLLAVKRAPGINWEENWGFAELYDAAYVDAAASFYQSLLILNNGAAGFNIYTGVATDQADANLVLNHSGAYPDAAPISESGIVTPKAEIARWLGSFMAAHGTEFLQSEPVQAAGWGFYLPYVRAAVWAATDEKQGAVHGRHLADFQTQMRAAHLDYALLNLEAASLDELKALPQLFAAGSLFMAASVQQKLADYVTTGGKLNWIGSLPTMDENGQPCRILAGLENGVRVTPRVEVESVVADPAGIQASSAADLWLRVHPEKDIQFLTVLIPADGSSRVEVDFTLSGRGHRLVLSAAPSGGGIFRLEGGKVTSYIIKGANTFLDQIVAPMCSFDGEDDRLNIPGECARINGRVSSSQTKPV